MIEPLRQGFRRTLDVVFPCDCEHCGEIVPEAARWKFLCENCADRIDWIRGPVCEICGHPYPGIGAGQACEHCEALEPVFTSGRCAVLVPVPLHRTRERERGFNQSVVLARALAKTLPVAGIENLLLRRRRTGTQTRLPRADRMKNVRGAFALSPEAVVRADLTYVVVDDVFTTGSTMNECCRVLRNAGAKSLKVLAFAHG